MKNWLPLGVPVTINKYIDATPMIFARVLNLRPKGFSPLILSNYSSNLFLPQGTPPSIYQIGQYYYVHSRHNHIQ